MTDYSNIIAIETATSACSAALRINGEVQQVLEIGNNIHSQRLLAMIAELMRNAALEITQLDAVAVGQGPGSFTGLRIGVGVAQGIAYGAGCNMLGVSSLAALAQQSSSNGRVLAAIDARMDEVYWGLYQKTDDQLELSGEHRVTSPADVPIGQADCLVGNAWQQYADSFTQSPIEPPLPHQQHFYPQASSVLRLAERSYQAGAGVSPIEFAPEYVRNNVAKKAAKKPVKK